MEINRLTRFSATYNRFSLFTLPQTLPTLLRNTLRPLHQSLFWPQSSTVHLLAALLLSASSDRAHSFAPLLPPLFTFQPLFNSNTIFSLPNSEPCSQLILQFRHHAILLATVAQHGLP